jgi:hypothetical protein
MKKYLLFMLVAIGLSNCGKVGFNESADYYRKMDMNFILLEKRTLNHGREVNFIMKRIHGLHGIMKISKLEIR